MCFRAFSMSSLLSCMIVRSAALVGSVATGGTPGTGGSDTGVTPEAAQAWR